MNPLFISIGATPPAFYRCILPASNFNADWIGVYGGPPGKAPVIAGKIEAHELDTDKYDVIIAQQPVGDEWLNAIKQWQSEGKKVVFEVDDFLHGVRKCKGHTHQAVYHKKKIKQFEECMRQCDAMICSTQFLSDQYKKYNPNQYVCKNGIDVQRYNVERPEREYLMIGWAGGTGHNLAVGPWLEQVSQVMSVYENVGFVSVGVRYGEAMSYRFPNRSLTAPWTTLENYPYALTNMDIAIAPAHDSKYFKSKSDLRWLESSALGIPTIASPIVYHEIEDEKTGLLAETDKDAGDLLMELIEDESLRRDLGQQAKEYVTEHRSIEKMASQWESALEQILS